MRSQLLLVPAAVCMAAPAWANAYFLTGPEAQEKLFPGATFTEDFRMMTDRQMKAVEKEAEAPLYERAFRMWKVSTGGYFFVDQVIGLETTITYALGLNAQGVVTGIEIMECLPDYSRIRGADWRAQFKAKKFGDLWKKDEIESVSGTTLSTVHITEGVRKVLTAFDMLVQHPRK